MTNATVSDANNETPRAQVVFAYPAAAPLARGVPCGLAQPTRFRRWSIVLPDFWEYPALRVLQLAIAILAIVIALATAI